MNIQKSLKPVLIILLGLALIGAGYYIYKQDKVGETVENSQGFIINGIWKFKEVSNKNNLNGVDSPVWNYILTINNNDETVGTLYIDGYQTTARLNVRINKLNDSANVIFDSYGIGNQFEKYQKGDVLITVSPDSNEDSMSIGWYKIQPNIKENESGSIFIRQKDVELSTEDIEDIRKLNVADPIISNVSFAISGNNLLVTKEGKTIQTLALGEDALSALSLENTHINDKKFILNHDVNFDGHDDVAILTGVGYGGVNIFYDYYIFNTTTSKLEKSDKLLQVSNPTIDIKSKKITSSYRSGPQWYSKTFKWNGSTYIVSEAITE
jgi:hypothetical protein